jgi:hypothetical protein
MTPYVKDKLKEKDGGTAWGPSTKKKKKKKVSLKWQVLSVFPKTKRNWFSVLLFCSYLTNSMRACSQQLQTLSCISCATPNSAIWTVTRKVSHLGSSLCTWVTLVKNLLLYHGTAFIKTAQFQMEKQRTAIFQQDKFVYSHGR